MMLISKTIKITSLALFAMLLGACSTANTKVGSVLGLDTDLKLTFFADSNLNPDDKDVPSPVIIRMYELKSTALFDKANFVDLYEQDTAILKTSLISKQALKAIKPNQELVSKFVLHKDTQFVGLYVEFLQYENARYKITLPVEQNNVLASSAELKLTSNSIIILK